MDLLNTQHTQSGQGFDVGRVILSVELNDFP